MLFDEGYVVEDFDEVEGLLDAIRTIMNSQFNEVLMSGNDIEKQK